MFTKLFERTVSLNSENIAITWKGENITWSELHERTKRVASGLQLLGVGQGDSIALMLGNTPAFITGFLAAARLGAPVILINKNTQAAVSYTHLTLPTTPYV